MCRANDFRYEFKIGFIVVTISIWIVLLLLFVFVVIRYDDWEIIKLTIKLAAFAII